MLKIWSRRYQTGLVSKAGKYAGRRKNIPSKKTHHGNENSPSSGQLF